MNDAVLLLLFPAAAALLIPAVSLASKSFAQWIALAATIAGIVYGGTLYPAISAQPTSVIIGTWRPPFGINLYVSPLTLGLTILVFSAAAAVLISDLSSRSRKSSQFYLLYSLMVMAAVGLILTGDLFNMFVFLEIGSIATFALIADGNEGSGPAGALRYLFLAQLTSLLMLAGIGLVYSATGVVNIASLTKFSALNPAFGFLVGALIVLPLLLEAKQFPFNAWVGGAYRGASPAIGATMSGLTTVAVVMVLTRLLVTMMSDGSAFVGGASRLRTVVLLIGTATVLISETAAFREREMKRVLGYSTAGQMGMITIGIAIASESALRGVVFLLVSHTLAKVLLFLVAGAAIRVTGHDRWDEMKGIARRLPLLGLLFAVGALALMGIPLFSGFWGKLELIRAGLTLGGLESAGVIAVLVATVIEGAYFLKIVHALFEAPDESSADSKMDSSAAGAPPRYSIAFLVPSVILAAAILVLGIAPGIINSWVTSATTELLNPVSGYVSHIVALGGIQ